MVSKKLVTFLVALGLSTAVTLTGATSASACSNNSTGQGSGQSSGQGNSGGGQSSGGQGQNGQGALQSLPRAGVSGCSFSFAPAVRPDSFALASISQCEETVNSLQWTTWNGTVAMARGWNSYNSCQPSCVSSVTYIDRMAQVMLNDVVPTTSGLLFRTLSWRDAISQGMPPHCPAKGVCVSVFHWTPWSSETLRLSSASYAVGAVCPRADLGLAADGKGAAYEFSGQAPLVWCEIVRGPGLALKTQPEWTR